MEIICTSCSTKLAIPDAKVPKNAIFRVTCPKCLTKVRASTMAAQSRAPGAGRVPTAPVFTRTAPPPPPPPEPEEPMEEFDSSDVKDEGLASSPEEDEFVEDRKLAMVCIDSAPQRATVKTALDGLGYTVHIPLKPDDAVQRIRANRYELVIIHEEYGGSPQGNLVLQTIQPMTMALRRHMCVGLVGTQFRTLDNMTAFAKSVNFVVADWELPKILGIARQAVAENDQFYRVFRESLRDAGKM
jgi:CheY-like chemotaxis protein